MVLKNPLKSFDLSKNKSSIDLNSQKNYDSRFEQTNELSNEDKILDYNGKINKKLNDKFLLAPKININKPPSFNKKKTILENKISESIISINKKFNMKNSTNACPQILVADQNKGILLLKSNSLPLEENSNKKSEMIVKNYKQQNQNNNPKSLSGNKNFDGPGIKIKQITNRKNCLSSTNIKNNNNINENSPKKNNVKQNNNNNIIDEKINNDNNNHQQNNKNKINEKIKLLSKREKSFYLLSQSTVLRLCERIFFSKSTLKVRALAPIKEILISNELFIQDKIKSLYEKLNSYDKILEQPFTPSKLAEITLNFITTDDEREFRNLFFLIKSNDDNKISKDFYIKYINILFYLLKNYFIEFKESDNLPKMLLEYLNSLGYKYFKDYLYDLLIVKKNKKESLIKKFNNFMDLNEKLPNMIKNNGEIKSNKFIAFSYFLVKEFIDYGMKIKNIIVLKEDTEHFIDTLRFKIKRLRLKDLD